MLVELKKSEILELLDLAIDKADTFDNFPKTQEVKKFSFRKWQYVTTIEPIHYEWYVWQVRLPKYLRSLKSDILITDKDKYLVKFYSYVSLLNLINGSDFNPFVIGEI